jgi:hypothetical protein
MVIMDWAKIVFPCPSMSMIFDLTKKKQMSAIDSVNKKLSTEEIAKMLRRSSDLVDYRIKRLGLWREHSGKQIRLSSD